MKLIIAPFLIALLLGGGVKAQNIITSSFPLKKSGEVNFTIGDLAVSLNPEIDEGFIALVLPPEISSGIIPVNEAPLFRMDRETKRLTITLAASVNFEGAVYRICSIQGVVVISGVLSDRRAEIACDLFPPGIYIAEVEVKGERRYFSKISTL